MTAEPDWDEPVQVTGPLAEVVAGTLCKRGHTMTAEQVRAEMARLSAGRTALGRS